MTETYYQIVEKGKENKNGNIVKVSINGLEIVAGEEYNLDGEKLLEKYEIQNNSYRILDINENYRFFQIEEDRAKLLISDWGDYILSAGYCHPQTGKNCQPDEDWRDM